MRKTCILVIEDELLVGMDIVSTLENAGFDTVEHAATERDALQLIEAEAWDAVVADANLNGRSVADIATLLHNKAIPFVVLTGYDRESLPAAVGSAPVLGKPFHALILVQTVRALVER